MTRTSTPTPTEPKPAKAKVETKAEAQALVSRLLACVQSTGRTGKSTFNEIVIALCRRHEILFEAFDADGEHQTLSRRYPDDAGSFDAVRSNEEFNRLMEAIRADFPVTIIDFPAQNTSYILDGFERLAMLDIWERKGIRPTMLVFASDDPTAMQSASQTKDFCADRADYLLIKNPARFPSTAFFKAPMAAWFIDRNSPVITMPEAQPSTVAAWAALERKLKQSLTLDAACTHPGLSEIKRAELQYLRDRVIAQLEEHAAFILPDPGLIKTRSQVAEKAKRTRVDPFDDPNY